MAITLIRPFNLDPTADYTFNKVTVSGNMDLSGTGNVTLGSVSNVHITGGTANYVLSTDGAGNLSWVAQTGGGGGGSYIANGNSNVDIPTANGNVTISSAGNANVVVVTGTGMNVAGTINATGNITAINVNGGNLVTANYVTGTLITAAQPNITSLGTLSNLTSNGTINFTNATNVSLGAIANLKVTGGSNGQYLSTDGSGNLNFSNISTISNGNSNVNIPSANGNVNISSAGNANVVVVTGTGMNVAGTINATGNITAANIITGGGGGGNLTGANYIVSNYFTGTLTTSSQPNITTVGTLSNLNVSESIIRIQSGPNGSAPTSNSGKDVGSALNYFDADGDKIAFVGWDVSNAEIALSSNTTITSGIATFNQYANVRANNFIGNGSQLTNVVATTVTTNAQPNITSVGTLSNLTSNGNVNLSNASNISLGSLANIHISGGTANYVLSTDGAGNLTWVEQTGGGGGGGGSVTLSNTTANATFYPVFANATSGNMSTAYLSGSSLTFNPSTGTLTAQDINTLSDAALKDNVEPILDPFEVLKQLFGVGFTWRNTGKKSYGVIAQMIEKILPELVTETPDGKKTVNYIPIIAFLLEAVKKQQEDIDQLKKR